jgi:hypothetical protein
VVETVQGTWRLIELPKVSDVRGNLTAIEGRRHVPFEIARVYYVYDVPSGSVRAAHAHKRLEQVFLAFAGSFKIHVEDGHQKTSYVLNRPNIGLYVPPGVWRLLDDFSGGAVCVVLASDIYDETDYIRSYEDFRRFVGAGKLGETGGRDRATVGEQP